MGFRFRRHIKIMPGLWLNLSKSGISTSIGGHGLTANVKGGKVTTTASLPGTGISYRSTSGKHQDAERREDAPAPPEGKVHWLLVLTLILAVLYLLGR